MNLRSVILLSCCFFTSYCLSAQWAVSNTFGSTFDDNAQSICADEQGNYYITGAYSNTLSIQGVNLPNTNSLQFYVAKFNSNNVLQWVRYSQNIAGIPGMMEGVAISCQQKGDLVAVTGQFIGSLNLSGTSISTTTSQYDVFIAVYNKTGSLVSLKKGGGTGSPKRVILTETNLYWFGTAHSPNFMGFGQGGSSGAVVCKLGPNGGIFGWMKTLTPVSAGSMAFASDMCLDPDGNIFLTGTFKGSIGFNGTNTSSILSGFSQFNVYLARYDNNGNVIWFRQDGMPTNNSEIPKCIVTDNQGGLYLTGVFKGNVTLGGVMLNSSSANDTDLFLCKYKSNNGTSVWGKRIGSTTATAAIQEPFGMRFNSVNSRIYICGWFDGSVNFGSVTLSSGNSIDGFLGAFDLNGNGVAASAVQTSVVSSTVRCKDILIHPTNNQIYSIGIFSGNGIAFPGAGNHNSNGGTDFFISRM